MVKVVLIIAALFILASMLLSLYRFLRGPSTFDRIIAFDVMTIASIGLIALISWFAGRVIYLDIAIVYGLLSFLGVIIIAKYLEKTL